MKKFAFTLAETLIVIGIIGVIAALTLPSLSNDTQGKETVTKVKKVYSNLENALGRAIAEYGPIDEWTVNLSSADEISIKISERIIEFMKVQKKCGLAINVGCFASGSQHPWVLPSTNTPSHDSAANKYKFILSDGTSVAFDVGVTSNRYSGITMVYVDIDGPNKGKSTDGTDQFIFIIDENGKVSPYEVPQGDFVTSCFSYSSCASWIMKANNVDYLKSDPISRKCTNGTTLGSNVLSCD